MKHTSHTRAVRFLSGLFYFFSIFMFMNAFNAGSVYSQWAPQSVPVYQPIIGIEFVDENTGWAITYNSSLTDTAYIIATTNGGTDWFIQFHGNVGLQSLDAVSRNICYAGGVDVNGDALFIETSNGGSNWILNNIGANKVPDDMFFLNKDTGYICDNFSGGLYLTTDGGTTWLNRQNGINTYPRTLFFLNCDTGFCGAGVSLFRTTNSGVIWSEIFNFSIFGNRRPLTLQFLKNGMGWAGLTNNGVGITTNGGSNWSLVIPVTIGSYEIQGLSFVNDSVGWAGPDISERIYKTQNGGFNWVEQNPHVWGSRSISFIDTVIGWTGYLGISRTTNGGLTYVSGINSETPKSFSLQQNYPNPFNPTTKISFTIIASSEVSLTVYDILGRQVFKWESDGLLHPGSYEYLFTKSDLSSGVYIYKLTAKSSVDKLLFVDSKKMIYLK